MDNPNQDAKIGDILYAKNNRNRYGIRSHFIIYLMEDPSSKHQFLGAMLTHSSQAGNIALNTAHFSNHDKNGNIYQVSYQNSFISSHLYHKKNDWHPFTKVGVLSGDGVKFVMAAIGSKTPTTFKYNE